MESFARTCIHLSEEKGRLMSSKVKVQLFPNTLIKTAQLNSSSI